MEDAIKLLTNYGVPKDKARQVAYDVAQAMTDWWDLEDIMFMEDELGVSLNNAQEKEALARWRTRDSYGELDREGIEWAIKETIKEK